MSMQLGIPQQCATEGHMSNLMMCFIEQPKCREKCFTMDFSRNAGLFDIPDYFQEENAILDCSEVEEPVCAYTECRDCKPCTDIINALYRCVISHTTIVDPKLKTMANCPLDCSGDSFLVDSENIEESVDEEVDVDEDIEGNVTDVNGNWTEVEDIEEVDTSGEIDGNVTDANGNWTAVEDTEDYPTADNADADAGLDYSNIKIDGTRSLLDLN